MKKGNVILILFFAFSFLTKLGAQDLHFSQFQYSPLNLGPSEVGNMDADIRITALHRRQWASVTVPYQTFSLSVDGKLNAWKDYFKGLGAGLLINQDKAGDGALQTLQLTLALSYSLALTKDSIHFLHLGVNGGFVQKNLDINKLNFDNQFDGDNFIPQSPTGESFDRTNYTYADIGIAAGWSAHFTKTIWNAGIQFQHLNRADLSYYNSGKVRLPILTQMHIGSNFTFSENISFLPAVNFMMQDNFREVNVGMEAKLTMHNEAAKRYAVGLGLFYRTSDALIPMISLYYNKFRLGFSYDINISSLKKASNYKGGPEITLIYMAKKIKSNSQRRIICPLY